jgi:hypothetical protein
MPAASNTLIFGHKRRRTVGGVNEIQVIEAFRSSCEHQAAGEPNSDNSELYDSDGDHKPRPKLRRNAYSREKKLLAVTYCELTDMLGKKEEDPMCWNYSYSGITINTSSEVGEVRCRTRLEMCLRRLTASHGQLRISVLCYRTSEPAEMLCSSVCAYIGDLRPIEIIKQYNLFHAAHTITHISVISTQWSQYHCVWHHLN